MSSANGNGSDAGWVIAPSDTVLVTGAAGFIGRRVVARLVKRGFLRIRCLVRPGSNLEEIARACGTSCLPQLVEIVRGNLLSKEDCDRAGRDVRVVYHLAAGSGEKSYPDAFMNSVVTTRNLLEVVRVNPSFRRFVNVSSFTVYSNRNKPAGKLLDETCPVDSQPAARGEAYTYAKVRQDQLVERYAREYGIKYAHLRPGVVYGPGKERITGRIGLGTFGIFLHLGGSNAIPLTYVDNCAEAIVLAGLSPNADNEAFNVVDDEIPSSRKFLRSYKRNVKGFGSLYVPHFASYLLCWMWEKYSAWSEGQLPPVFNRSMWHAYWQPTRYTNRKLKERIGWRQPVPTGTALQLHFESCRQHRAHA